MNKKERKAWKKLKGDNEYIAFLVENLNSEILQKEWHMNFSHMRLVQFLQNIVCFRILCMLDSSGYYISTSV